MDIRLTNLIIVVVVFLLIDITFINFVTGPLFNDMIRNIQGTEIELRPVVGLLAYVVMAISLYYFVVQDKRVLEQQDIIDAMVLGFVLFATFDLTNYAIFKDYELSTALIDMAWGTTLFGVTAYVSSKVMEMVN